VKPICFLLLLTALIACQPAADAPKDAPRTGQPNIVLIFADDLGYGDLSCYGSPVNQTPNLDRLAQEGVKMTSFYVAASVCTPSRAALLTGRYPIRHLPGNLGPESTHGLPLAEVTLPQLLQAQGYATMGIGKWHLGHATPELQPTGRGFDQYFGLMYSNDMIPPWVQTEVPMMMYDNGEPLREVTYQQEHLTDEFTEKGLAFIEANQDRPFFLYLPYSMPHLPVAAPAADIAAANGNLYRAVIQDIDEGVGKLRAKLAELGLAENTVFIFTSDNGPWHNLPDRMLQRGNERWHAGSSGPLRGAKTTTYEGGFRVPGLICWPGTVEPGTVSNEMASAMDLFATLALAGGASLPTDRPIDGRDLTAFLQGEAAASPRDTLFYFAHKRLEAVRIGDWKLSLREPGQPQLFNLETDPSEMYNRYEAEPERVTPLQAAMVAFRAETGAEPPRSK
jgi:arylsulfatase A